MKEQGRLAATLLIVLFIACGNAFAGTVPETPENLKAPAGETLSVEAQARGVQIYECKAAAGDPARFEWVFKAPEAELFGSAGKKIGKHYAGPTWESADGSKVAGAVKAKDNGPDPGAIPWLLLTAKSTSGEGVFSGVTSIQRLKTAGGKPPAEGCTQTEAGKELRVPYTATYYFYVKDRP